MKTVEYKIIRNPKLAMARSIKALKLYSLNENSMPEPNQGREKIKFSLNILITTRRHSVIPDREMISIALRNLFGTSNANIPKTKGMIIGKNNILSIILLSPVN
jgi:hypothetical protein